MKRFYKEVSTEPGDQGYIICLDGRCIKTPNKAELNARTSKLAELSAKEWDAQKDLIDPNSMPVTQLLNTRIDRVSRDRTEMEKLVMNYLNTDLICYRADNPEELVKRQDDIWQPWVEWFDDKYKAKLQTTSGLAALKQDDKIHEALAQHIREMDDDRFTILQMLTPASGSIILAVAFVEGDAGEDDILNSAFLEENYKYDLYNEDLHGGDPLTEKKKKALKADLLAAKAYLDALD